MFIFWDKGSMILDGWRRDNVGIYCCRSRRLWRYYQGSKQHLKEASPKTEGRLTNGPPCRSSRDPRPNFNYSAWTSDAAQTPVIVCVRAARLWGDQARLFGSGELVAVTVIPLPMQLSVRFSCSYVGFLNFYITCHPAILFILYQCQNVIGHSWCVEICW